MLEEEQLENTPEAVFTRLVLLVFRLNGVLLAAGDRMAAPAGQTSARWQVMGVIDHGPLTVSAVARTMGLRRQSVQRTADLLVADGVAEYVDNLADRRAKLLALTPSGRRALRRIEGAQHVWASENGEALGLEQLLETETALEKLLAQLAGEAAITGAVSQPKRRRER
jgi:DNA-binding MarR family transcriptional regulator